MVESLPSVLLFVGDDAYLKDKAIDKAVSSAVSGGPVELNCRVFYGGESDPAEILDYARTAPFLAGRRAVVIRRFDRFNAKETALLAGNIRAFAGRALFILDAGGDYRAGGSGLEGCAEVTRFDGVSASDFRRWAKDRIRESGGLGITEEALARLEELQEHNLLSLSRELEKLVAFSGGGRDINISDIDEIVGRNLEISAFELTDHIGRGDADAALRIASELMLGGTRPHEIVGLLSWHLRRMLKARVMEERGLSDRAIAGSLKIANRYSADFFSQLRKNTAAAIRRKLETLLKADLKIKRAAIRPALILENAILDLCLGCGGG